MAASAYKPLPGSMIPAFATTDIHGNSISQQSLVGKPLWLAFFRFARCPFCNLRLYEMKDAQQELAGVRIVGIFQSSKENLLEHLPKVHQWFTMIADPDETLYRLFGVEAGIAGMLSFNVLRKTVEAVQKGVPMGPPEGTFARIPADFLIDAKGSVVESFYGQDVTDHIPLARVRTWLGKSAVR